MNVYPGYRPRHEAYIDRLARKVMAATKPDRTTTNSTTPRTVGEPVRREPKQ